MTAANTAPASLDLITHACRELGIDPLAHGLQLLEAAALTTPLIQPLNPAVDASRDGAWCEVQGHGPYTPPLVPYPLVPSRPALICRVDAPAAAQVAAVLRQRYPPAHPAVLVSPGAAPRQVELRALAGQAGLDPLTCIYLAPLPPLDDLRGPEGAAFVVARLLGPYGCPWDREQTHRSLRASLQEETFEALEALDAGDPDAMAEEFGDLLLHVLMHSEMARQAGAFDLGSVYEHLTAKLIRRHPHVFGDQAATSSGEVLANWEQIKRAERETKGQPPRGPLDGVPPGLPALAVAQQLTRKAARQGFEWPDSSGAWAKLHEEIAELREAVAQRDARGTHLVEQELGDLLLALANLARWLEIDAESALREANSRFRRRFAALADRVRSQGRDLAALSIDELLALWSAVKE